MDIRRIIRHLLTTHWMVRRAFSRDARAAIGRAIKACDAGHAGAVCFAVEGALHSAALLRGQSARERAIEVFSQLRVWDTEHNNGVLIYVLLADRAVEIVADRGVHEKVGETGWQAICAPMETAFRQAAYRDGAVKGIQAVAQHLTTHYPAIGPNRDELPDAPVML
ncbi:TPM domain-containing protein (plasmid) [Burkholderia thailandensis]|uniref:TPM domain-containing protein n=1 Tax=Burkholderia thailandensis TaxID=57975 RepID=UPI00192D949D|nr:TPM domain-containing protein [Burkholderia thailandensis]MBS2132106.1 TPM domain-containing protein [Burkholderia thailandensis]QRA15217.1 TPM domain-containing protein [Burkholderia thailandensis]